MALTFGMDVEVPVIAASVGPEMVADLIVITQGWAEEVVSRARKYPPRPPGSTYRRTGNLANRWKKPITVYRGGDVTAFFENSAKYAEKVHGDAEGDNQAAIHAGRWLTIPELGDAVNPSLEFRAQAAMNARIARAITQKKV